MQICLSLIDNSGVIVVDCLAIIDLSAPELVAH